MDSLGGKGLAVLLCLLTGAFAPGRAPYAAAAAIVESNAAAAGRTGFGGPIGIPGTPLAPLGGPSYSLAVQGYSLNQSVASLPLAFERASLGDGRLSIPALAAQSRALSSAAVPPRDAPQALRSRAAMNETPGTEPRRPPPSSDDARVRELAHGLDAAALNDPHSDKSGYLRRLYEGAARMTPRAAHAIFRWRTTAPSSGLQQAPVATGPPRAAPQPPPPDSVREDPQASRGTFSRIGSALRARAAEMRADFNSFTSSEKAYVVGQALYVVSLSVYLLSLPLLVHALTGSAAMTGAARAVHYWVFGAASLVAGDIVSRSPLGRVLGATTAARAAILGTIGVLALAGGLPIPLFLGLIALNAVAVAHNNLVGMGTGGADRVFASPERKKKALYLYNAIKYSIFLAAPLVVGPLVDGVDFLFGPGIGAAAGFIAFAALMLKVRAIFTRVAPPAEASSGSPPEESLLPRARRAAAGLVDVLRRAPGRMRGAARVITGNKTILARAGMAVPGEFIEDALFAVVLSTLALDVLMAGATGSAILFAGMNLGGVLASAFLANTLKLERRLGVYRYLRLLSIGAALAFIPSIALWSLPPVWAAFPVVLLMKLLYEPASQRMQELLQVAVRNDPAARKAQDDVYGLLSAVETAAAGLGGFAFAWLFLHSGPGSLAFELLGVNAPMKAVTLTLAIVSIATLVGVFLVKRQVYRRHRSAPGVEAKTLAKLEPNLRRLGYPALETREDRSPADDRRPTVALLAPPSLYKLAVAREGGRRSPGDVHLVLDPSWLIQELQPDGTHRLLLTKGLSFDREGRPSLVEYRHPRRVRYFANFFTQGANERADGVPLEWNLDTPMSNSVELERVVNEKLHTRRLLSKVGLAVPASLAFLMSAHPYLAAAGGADRSEALPREAAQVRRRLEGFVDAYGGRELVVKPSGPSAHSAKGVDFFASRDLDAMARRIGELARDGSAAEDGSILVDERIEPPALYFRHGDGGEREALYSSGPRPMRLLTPEEIRRLPPGARERKDWNLRVLVARTPANGAETTMILPRAGAWGLPTNAEPPNPEDAAAFIRFEDLVAALRLQHGLLASAGDAEAFKAEIEALGRRALEAVMEGERGRAVPFGAARRAQTDMIGLDVMVAVEDGRLVPKIIEINDHDSGGQWQMDVFHPESAGRHSSAWIATMLARARRDAMKGRRLIVVGAGDPSRRALFEKARELGVELVLVDRPGSWASALAAEFVAIDDARPEESLAAARKKLLKSARKNGRLEGIVSLSDDPALASSLARALGVNHAPSGPAAHSARGEESEELLLAAGLGLPAAPYPSR